MGFGHGRRVLIWAVSTTFTSLFHSAHLQKLHYLLHQEAYRYSTTKDCTWVERSFRQPADLEASFSIPWIAQFASNLLGSSR
jgi:hypothetical protein